jgi:SAM-dependent methyltransferase
MAAKHYLLPLVRSKHVPYNAHDFWNSWYASVNAAGADDRVTISPTADLVTTAYHYSLVETGILGYFATRQHSPVNTVVDIGSGAGHWIHFYRSVFQARRVVGLDISAACAQVLRARYSNDAEVEIRQGDVSRGDVELPGMCDVVNAIGVMFHIVDDAAWESALARLAEALTSTGVLIVGGQFGFITQDVQFHSADCFCGGEQGASVLHHGNLVNKRIRSLRVWKDACRRVGLKAAGLVRVAHMAKIPIPENNLLFLVKK